MCYKPPCHTLKTKPLFYVAMVILKKESISERRKSKMTFP